MQLLFAYVIIDTVRTVYEEIEKLISPLTKIFTLTTNPAIDLHIYADSLKIGGVSTARATQRHSGGKGVNLSRALAALDIESECIVFAGRENAGEYLAGLSGMKGVCERLIDGAVRENINIHTPEGDSVITTAGAALTEADIRSLEYYLYSQARAGDILCFSGRVASEENKDALVPIFGELSKRGVLVILDSASLTLSDIEIINPYAIKPNAEELSALFGRDSVTREEAALLARELCVRGVGLSLVTLGADGAILVSAKEAYYAKAPRIEVRSTTGAGDSALAGLICSTLGGINMSVALRYSVATGSAASMTEGTLPPDPCEIKKLLPLISAERVW